MHDHSTAKKMSSVKTAMMIVPGVVTGIATSMQAMTILGTIAASATKGAGIGLAIGAVVGGPAAPFLAVGLAVLGGITGAAIGYTAYTLGNKLISSSQSQEAQKQNAEKLADETDAKNELIYSIMKTEKKREQQGNLYIASMDDKQKNRGILYEVLNNLNLGKTQGEFFASKVHELRTKAEFSQKHLQRSYNLEHNKPAIREKYVKLLVANSQVHSAKDTGLLSRIQKWAAEKLLKHDPIKGSYYMGEVNPVTFFSENKAEKIQTPDGRTELLNALSSMDKTQLEEVRQSQQQQAAAEVNALQPQPVAVNLGM